MKNKTTITLNTPNEYSSDVSEEYLYLNKGDTVFHEDIEYIYGTKRYLKDEIKLIVFKLEDL